MSGWRVIRRIHSVIIHRSLLFALYAAVKVGLFHEKLKRNVRNEAGGRQKGLIRAMSDGWLLLLIPLESEAHSCRLLLLLSVSVNSPFKQIPPFRNLLIRRINPIFAEISMEKCVSLHFSIRKDVLEVILWK